MLKHPLKPFSIKITMNCTFGVGKVNANVGMGGQGGEGSKDIS